ncbi:MAG: hypothetical protein PHT12_02400 [Patescibacteria group bacterium]|nr:hypothetical protein [Patescibacteria group bacterium]
MSNNKKSGDIGEKEVVELVRCPNCARKLMVLPPSYPLYDVQCSGCMFRAQVKTNLSKPRAVVFGATWDIMKKVFKAGFIMPPLILNFKWNEKGVARQEIRFYPFVPKDHLMPYQLSQKAQRANLWMFRYVGLDKVPYFLCYKK